MASGRRPESPRARLGADTWRLACPWSPCACPRDGQAESSRRCGRDRLEHRATAPGTRATHSGRGATRSRRVDGGGDPPGGAHRGHGGPKRAPPHATSLSVRHRPTVSRVPPEGQGSLVLPRSRWAGVGRRGSRWGYEPFGSSSGLVTDAQSEHGAPQSSTPPGRSGQRHRRGLGVLGATVGGRQGCSCRRSAGPAP